MLIRGVYAFELIGQFLLSLYELIDSEIIEDIKVLGRDLCLTVGKQGPVDISYELDFQVLGGLGGHTIIYANSPLIPSHLSQDTVYKKKRYRQGSLAVNSSLPAVV